MLNPGAESFHRELSIFLNSLKERFTDAKDLEIDAGGRRPSKGGREIPLKRIKYTR